MEKFSMINFQFSNKSQTAKLPNCATIIPHAQTAEEDVIMEFNQNTIGLLLFYTTGLLIVIGFFLLALPSIYKGPLKLEEAK